MPFHKISKIYLDMDGVIADFNAEYIRQHGIHPRQAEKEKKFESHFDRLILVLSIYSIKSPIKKYKNFPMKPSLNSLLK